MRSNRASSPIGAMKWAPSGMPSAVSHSGKLIAGVPVKLFSGVYGAAAKSSA